MDSIYTTKGSREQLGLHPKQMGGSLYGLKLEIQNSTDEPHLWTEAPWLTRAHTPCLRRTQVQFPAPCMLGNSQMPVAPQRPEISGLPKHWHIGTHTIHRPTHTHINNSLNLYFKKKISERYQMFMYNTAIYVSSSGHSSIIKKQGWTVQCKDRILQFLYTVGVWLQSQEPEVHKYKLLMAHSISII